MSSNTKHLGLLKKDPIIDKNETFNIQTMLNNNWDKIDDAVEGIQSSIENVNIPDASLTQRGKVMLSNAIDQEREDVAATEKSVKLVSSEAKSYSDKLLDDQTKAFNLKMDNKAPLFSPTFSGSPTIGGKEIIHAGNIQQYIPDNNEQPHSVIYVDSTNGIDIPDNGSSKDPFKSVKYALKSMKKNLMPQATVIRLRAGVYTEDIGVYDFIGSKLELTSDSGTGANKSNVIIRGYCSMSGVYVANVNISNLRFENILDTRGSMTNIEISNCEFIGTNNSNRIYGIILGGGQATIRGCNFVNKDTAIAAGFCRLHLYSDCKGSTVTTGVLADHGSIVTVDGYFSIGAVTLFKTETGAQVFNTPSGTIRNS